METTEENETTDFHQLNSWYQEASNRLEKAELILLIYHHLVCLFDADEVRTRQAASPVVMNGSAGLKPDTATMVYRHNHIKDEMWAKMSSSERTAWAKGMAQRLGKSVTA